MTQPQQQFYDPALDGLAQNMTIVLKGKPFKPLYNKKTRNFFSYSYDLAERNDSANNDSDMTWVSTSDDRVPKYIQDKVREVKKLHYQVKDLREEYEEAEKDEDRRYMRQLRKQIALKMQEIDFIILPEAEREFVESKEAERYRKETQNELTLDANSIAALMGRSPQQISGTTADASIAQAKLEEANKQIAKLKEEASARAPVEEEGVEQVAPAPSGLGTPVEETAPEELPVQFNPEDIAPAMVEEHMEITEEKSPWAV